MHAVHLSTLIMFKSRRWAFVFILGFLCGLGPAALAGAAPNAVDTAEVQAAALDRLEAKAELGGELPVIVQLRTEALPALEPPADQGGNPQRAERNLRDRAARVARAQDRLAVGIAATSAGGSAHLNRFRYLPLGALHADRATIRRLRQLPDVLSITEDRPHPPLLNTSVPHIGGNLAYALGYTGVGQTVAIIDTGVQTTHPYFSGRVLSAYEACFSGSSIGSGSGVATGSGVANIVSLCPDLAACAGTYHYPANTACGAGAGFTCPAAGPCWHGTHVAGIAAGDNSTYRGVAPAASLIPIQVFLTENGSLVAYDSDIIAGLQHVLALSQSHADLQIAAVNMSLGGDTYASTLACNLDSAPTKTAIDALRAAGIATVVAAGNSYNPTAISTPGCISSAVSVGATDNSDAIAGFSNLSTPLSLFAPGVSVYAAVPTNAVGGASGTSMATPHVTGAFAVLRQKAAERLLSPSVDNLLAALRLSGIPITNGGNSYSTPRIQLDQALALLDTQAALPVELIMDSQVASTGISTVSGSFTSVTDTNAYGGTALRGASTSQANTLRFTPALAAGYYDISAWWPALGGNTSQASVTVSCDGITDQVLVSQQQNGSRWNAIGTYYCGANVYVEVSDAGEPNVIADAIRFASAEALTINTTSLATAGVGFSYHELLHATGGIPPFNWSVVSGVLPPGLTVDAAGGAIVGIPTQIGSYTFTVRVNDPYTQSAPRALAIAVGNTAPPPDIIIDNDAAGTSFTGEWRIASADAGFWGSSYRYGAAASTPSYRFTPTIIEPGQYRVYARWPAHPNRSTRVAYDVRDTTGVTTIEFNQQINGNQWNTLGVFSFTSGTSGYLEVSNRNGIYAIADAVRFEYVGPAPLTIQATATQAGRLGDVYSFSLVATGGALPYSWSVVSGALPAGLTLDATTGVIGGTPAQAGTFSFTVQVDDGQGQSATQAFSITVLAVAPVDIVIDNDAAGTSFTGEWRIASADAGFWGSSYRYGAAASTPSYRFTPTIIEPGQYRVYARWPAHPNRSTRVAYDVRDTTGVTTIEFNQQINGNQWNTLGVFSFTSGTSGYLEVSNRNGIYAIADAVRFEYVGN